MGSVRTFTTRARIARVVALACAMAVIGIAPAPAATTTGFSLELSTELPLVTSGTLVIDGPEPSSEQVRARYDGAQISRDVPPGDYTATFLPDSEIMTNESVTFVVREGEVTQIALRTVLAFARGTLVDTDGSPLAGVRVQAVHEGRVGNSATTGPDGTFRLDYLGLGTYHLDFPGVYQPTGVSFRADQHERVDLGQVVARRGGTVTTRVIDDIGAGVAGESATLAAPDGSWLRRATSTTDGALTFTGVPIGQATLVYDDHEVQPRSRDVSVVSRTTRVPDAVLPLLVWISGRINLPGRLRGDETAPAIQTTLFAESGGRPVGRPIETVQAAWYQDQGDRQWATFEFHARPSQRYVVRYSEIRANESRVLRHQVIAVGRESVWLNEVTPSFGAPITGEVRDVYFGRWPGGVVNFTDVPCDGALPKLGGGPRVMSGARAKFRVPTLPGHCYALTVGQIGLETTYVAGLERVRAGSTGVVVHPRLANRVPRVTAPDARTLRIAIRVRTLPRGLAAPVVDGGTVTVSEHGRVLGTATVDHGSAVVHLTRPLLRGSHQWRFDYSGTRLFKHSTSWRAGTVR